MRACPRPDEFSRPWPALPVDLCYMLPDALGKMREAVTGLYSVASGFKYPPDEDMAYT